jgi:hypothetical protein
MKQFAFNLVLQTYLKVSNYAVAGQNYILTEEYKLFTHIAP